jgi:BirA family biotin operon repressor/biotin-[acetyl-CoA-carboxylase] ligase
MSTDESEFTAATLEAALHGLRFGVPLHFFESLGSTNDEARRLAEAGAPEGTLVAADEQTAGRGRAGRPWQTPRGVALAASFILRPALPPTRLGWLTMLGGLAAAEAIEAMAGVAAALKWPNDVLVNGQKVAGVLAESALEGERLAFVVLGIGVNVSAVPTGAVGFPATSLAEAAGRPVDRVALLRALAASLGQWYPRLEDESLREAWAARLAWQGQPVVVHQGEATVQGVAAGVDADGALLLRLESGEERRVVAGDVSLRLVPGSTPDLQATHFIDEAIEAEFDQPPALEKKPGCPDGFTWRGETFRVAEMLEEWHDYRRRGRSARNMQPAHAAVAEKRGSWGVGRDYYRVRVEGGRIFDVYYDRAPKGSSRRKGTWVLFRELGEA